MRTLVLPITTILMALFLLATASSASSSETKSPLLGTWRTGLITQAAAEATLRTHGLSSWIPRFRRETPFTEPMALTLVVTRSEWDLYGKPKNKPRIEIDYDARYVVKGNTVEKIHSTGSTHLRWSLRGSGRTLALRWLRTTEPPYRGIPDKVFQHALYMTKSFSRAK
jgi:hypothetical protein